MRNRTPILIGAIVLFVVLAGAGLFAYRKNANPLPGSGHSTSSPSNQAAAPASIKTFAIEGKGFVIKGDNLGRVEIWAARGGAPRLVSTAELAVQGKNGADDTWTAVIPSGLHGASEVFARGYSKTGVPSAKIDLPQFFLTEL